MPRGHRNGVRTNESIREAAANLFYQRGFEATSLRAVAADVGIQVGSLYNHINSKDDLLTEIMASIMDELVDRMNAALDAAGPGAVDRLVAAIDVHLRYHAQNAQKVFIGNSELRSLNDEQRKIVVTRRGRYEILMRELITSAAEESGVELLDARLQTYAILALGMHIASWFQAKSRIKLEHVVNVYTEVCLRQLDIPRPTG